MIRKLAIDGNAPAFPDGPPKWPSADDEVHDALATAFANGSWGVYEGPNCTAFRNELADFHSVKFAHLCCSGTMAVELALRGLSVGPDDEVILAAYDFAGNFRAICATGATPVLVDLAPDSWSMDVEQLQDAIGPNTKAIVASHLHGCELAIDAICEFAKSQGILVVEDACQAHGAKNGNKRAGTRGDVGVLSFGGSKLMSAGRGGAVLTNNELFYQRIKIYAGEGNDAFAMSELQAAVLRPQLAKLDERNAIRNQRVRLLLSDTKPIASVSPVRLPDVDGAVCYFKLPWLIADSNENSIDRSWVVAAAIAEGIQLGEGFRGFAKRSSRRCRKPVPLENAIMAAERTVMLHHPILLRPEQEVSLLAQTLSSIFQAMSERSETKN
ncbi:MAG: aminotransferase class V-fold PLP-dependent enzyme [Planctomycetales bacterium]|nr:aminotransferase class V-fold PLP-dependent enzyme [Planctomycetales bacterium]